jgi:aminopeptidase
MIIDPRFTQLADGLCGFSTTLKRGERVLIDAFDVPDAMVIALVQAARRRGALPYVQLHRARITRELMLGAEEAQYAPVAEIELARMRKMDAYIALRGSDNIFEAADVPAARATGEPADETGARPSRGQDQVGGAALAHLRHGAAGGMSTEKFEDFYFRVCTLDYAG